MTIRRPKASVVIDPYETKTNKNKKKENEKGSTIVGSDSSVRKWKVSEVINPVITEIDRFSLKILSDNSNNCSYGSLNETFEKNVNFNFQNSFTSSSVDNHSKKVSIAAVPIFKIISPIKYEPVKAKRIFDVINETPNDDAIENISLKSINLPVENKYINAIKETPEPNINTNKNSPNQDANEQLISSPEEKSVEIVVEDIDDVQLSSSDDSNEPVKGCLIEVSVNNIELSEKKVDNLKVGRQAKLIAKENITKQCLFNEFRLPVDIDGTQVSNSQEIKKKLNASLETSPILKRSSPSIIESIGQQSKLCDISKAYLHSQDSSLISSPMEQEKLKLACQLPGRTSVAVSNSATIIQSEKPAVKNNSQFIDNEIPIQKRQFFKSSFCERRREEMERFSSLINKPIKKSDNGNYSIIESNKSKISKRAEKIPKSLKPSQNSCHPIIGSTKNKISKAEKIQKPRKPKTVKKKVDNKKKLKTSPGDIIFSGNSDKKQIDKIIIDDSENTKYDQPIEKARGLDNNSSDDLFSFTPQFVQKRKLKTLKTKTKSKDNRLSRCSNVYDIVSDVSSPLSKRKSVLSYKLNSKSMDYRENLQNESLTEMISNFESEIDRIKGIYQSLTYQLNQFKKILSSSNKI